VADALLHQEGDFLVREIVNKRGFYVLSCMQMVSDVGKVFLVAI
jgi:hypothetical protein